VRIVPEVASPPTDTIQRPIPAAPVPPRLPGTRGSVDQRPVLGLKTSITRMFVSNPAVRPATA
jgi:hypothetical protein